MRNSTILLALLLVLPVCYSRAQLQYGIKGGLNISDIVITNYIDKIAEANYHLKPGIHGGLYGHLDLENRFLLLAEILYSNQGVRANANINLHYITLPMLAQYKISPKLFAELGPQVGYLFAAKSRYGDVSNLYNNKLDIGLDAGFQYNISKAFFAGIRYYAGISSVIDVQESGNNSQLGENIKYQNRVLQLSAGYCIGKKRF